MARAKDPGISGRLKGWLRDYPYRISLGWEIFAGGGAPPPCSSPCWPWSARPSARPARTPLKSWRSS